MDKQKQHKKTQPILDADQREDLRAKFLENWKGPEAWAETFDAAATGTGGIQFPDNLTAEQLIARTEMLQGAAVPAPDEIHPGPPELSPLTEPGFCKALGCRLKTTAEILHRKGRLATDLIVLTPPEAVWVGAILELAGELSDAERNGSLQEELQPGDCGPGLVSQITDLDMEGPDPSPMDVYTGASVTTDPKGWRADDTESE